MNNIIWNISFFRINLFRKCKKRKKNKKIRLQYWQEITGVGIMYNTLKSFEIRKRLKGILLFLYFTKYIKSGIFISDQRDNKKY